MRMACGRESSPEAAGTLVVAAPSPGSILHHPGGAGWSWRQCGCQKDPCETKFQFCQVPRRGGIKLQLLFGVRIELAIESLPYPRFRTRIVQSPLRLPGRGVYLALLSHSKLRVDLSQDQIYKKLSQGNSQAQGLLWVQYNL